MCVRDVHLGLCVGHGVFETRERRERHTEREKGGRHTYIVGVCVRLEILKRI